MLGRYTTGPVVAMAEHTRGVRPCRPRHDRWEGSCAMQLACIVAGRPPGDASELHHRGNVARAHDLVWMRDQVPVLYSPTMTMIDLRSDTVTKPTPAMRRAMADAEVGDDVFGDDPTVNALEERAAELLGKEAGLFVASGTMGNLTAMMAHLARGQEVIAGAQHHLVIDEAAGHAVIVGASARSLEDRPDGTLDPAAIDAAFRDPTDPHEPLSGLITLENTHAHSMAQPLTPAYTREVAAIARRHGVPLHIDGARFWNSVVAQRPAGVTARDLADPAD